MNRRPLVLAIFILIATLAKSTPSNLQTSNKQPDPKATTSNESNEKTSNTPITIKGTITAINQPSTEEQARQTNEDSKTVWQKVFAPEQWVNIVLSCFAAIGLIVAISTLKKMERQTAATEIAAKATKESVDMLRLVESPHVFVSRIKLKDIGEEGKKPVALVYFKNSGHTVAVNAMLSIGIRIKNEPRISHQEFLECVPQGKFTVAPDDEICLPMSHDLLPTEYLANWNRGGGSSHLFVFGEIIYDDTIRSQTQRYRYLGRYITWELPRPKYIPQFWILNNLSKDEGISCG